MSVKRHSVHGARKLMERITKPDIHKAFFKRLVFDDSQKVRKVYRKTLVPGSLFQ